VLTRWDARMTEFLETNEQGTIAFMVLPKTFGFGEFA
jgi:beta-lactamase superfamily II metal-dependent hydrolase